jgi:hypothetical protein
MKERKHLSITWSIVQKKKIVMEQCNSISAAGCQSGSIVSDPVKDDLILDILRGGKFYLATQQKQLLLLAGVDEGTLWINIPFVPERDGHEWSASEVVL